MHLVKAPQLEPVIMESDSPPALHDEPLATDAGEEEKMATTHYGDDQHFDAQAAVSEVLDQGVDDQQGEHLGPSEGKIFLVSLMAWQLNLLMLKTKH